jgi:two-component system sensor histidine kinase ArlS
MTLKKRIALFISLLFTLLFGVVCFIIVSMFSNFRKEEFEERLEEKALSTIKLLVDIQEVDNQMLKIIDQNSINKLYNEKTLVFDSDYKLLYSSLDDTKISWTKSDLDYLKQHKTFFKLDGENEIYGVFYDTNNTDYYALISANDSSGKRKLEFLFYLIIIVYAAFTVLTWMLTFYTIKRLLVPLDQLHTNISQINEYSLATRIQTNEKTQNEIDLIGIEFNLMMDRIEHAYQKQKEFTAQASHELRTPLARISGLIENELNLTDTKNKSLLNSVLQNVNQINELINSLLILSKVEAKNNQVTELARVDEAIYSSIEKTHSENKNFKINFEIVNSQNLENLLQVKSNQALLEIVFSNLLKNAYQYSNTMQASVKVQEKDGRLQVTISNTGETLTKEEQKKLFEPFSRGNNSKNKQGLGLGLRITHRILSVYNFTISYQASPNLNEFIIVF